MRNVHLALSCDLLNAFLLGAGKPICNWIIMQRYNAHTHAMHSWKRKQRNLCNCELLYRHAYTCVLNTYVNVYSVAANRMWRSNIFSLCGFVVAACGRWRPLFLVLVAITLASHIMWFYTFAVAKVCVNKQTNIFASLKLKAPTAYSR